jgi:Na+/H+ antiporter NhaD/arsenite permease-like protein
MMPVVAMRTSNDERLICCTLMLPITARILSESQVLAGAIIFLASYVVFALGKFPGLKIDRTGAAIIGAIAMVVFRVVLGNQALRSVDFGTIVLLFAMMLVVGALKLSGFFEWNAELILKYLRPAWLLPAVILTCGVLSAFFVNDIVCLVMVPFVLTLTQKLRLPPLPFLLAVATSSNIGSVATITGNPQNMLIGSFSAIAYRDFLLHLGPVAVIGLAIDWLVLHWAFSRQLRSIPIETEKIPLPPLDLSSLLKPVLVATGVVVAFLFGVPPVFAASAGAAILLISRSREPRKLYAEIDWGLLVFFVGLFVIVGGAENAGLIGRLFQFAERWNLHRPAVFTAVTALLCNLVSNVPAVMLLKSLVVNFANPHKAWLLLAMSSTLAGNLTITGSVANIIVVESARPNVRIDFWDYFRVGAPITLCTILVGALWLTYVA